MIQDSSLLAVFNSAHRVMKAENILKVNGFKILLIPAPRAILTDCGLAICFSNDLFDSLFEVLDSEKLLPETIYRKESDSLYKMVWNNENVESV